MIRPQQFRQALLLVGLIMGSLSDGYIFGQMSGMLSDLHTKDHSIPLNDNDLSWIASTINVSCVCGFAVAALVTEKFGRMRAISLLTTPILATWLMLYYAQDLSVLIISRLVVGVCYGGVLMLINMTTAECTSPHIRDYCLYLVMSVGPSIGTTLGHILGILLHWRIVALIGIIPTGISILVPYFCVESPAWLAFKGKFKECKKAFEALHVQDNAAEKELQLLLDIERFKQSKLSTEEKSLPYTLKRFMLHTKCKRFWNLMVLSCFIAVYRAAAGKILFSTCAATILENMTGRSDILLFTLLVDGLVILGSCLSCFLINMMRMRTLLFSGGVIANLILTTLSACLYFKSENNTYFSWINSTLLGLYFIIVYAGPYPVLESKFAEIYPLEFKSYYLFIAGTLNGVLIFLSVRFANDMFTLMGYHGVFFFYVIVMFFCLVYFWKYLPETKGRTLQEIEIFFQNNNFDNIYENVNSEQMKVLVN